MRVIRPGASRPAVFNTGRRRKARRRAAAVEEVAKIVAGLPSVKEDGDLSTPAARS